MAPNPEGYMRLYFKANNTPHRCEICGGNYKKYFKTVHERAKKHQNALNPNSVIDKRYKYD